MSDFGYTGKPIDDTESALGVFYGALGPGVGGQFIVTNRRLIIGPIDPEIKYEFDSNVMTGTENRNYLLRNALRRYAARSQASLGSIWLRYVSDIHPTNDASLFRPPGLQLISTTEEQLEISVVTRPTTPSISRINNAARDEIIELIKTAAAEAKTAPNIGVDLPPRMVGEAFRIAVANLRAGGAGGVSLNISPSLEIIDVERVTRPVRFVNVVVAEPETEHSVRLDQPLAPATSYDVLINIGVSRPDSLLPPPDGTWPQDELPEGDLRLRAVLRMDGWRSPTAVPFTLPAQGESFACDCAKDIQHNAECRNDPWVRFSITSPHRPRRWAGELAIYYQAVVVHAQRLVLPTGTRASGGPRAELLYRLTTSFTNLGELADRTASILISEASSRVMVNGVSFLDNPMSATTAIADDAARMVRDILYDIHLCFVDGKEISRYDSHHSKSQANFEADLRLLARAGAEVYEALFPDTQSWSTLPSLLRHEARARRRPATLCIAEPSSKGRSDLHIPWSVVYDLPIGTDPNSYKICPSVRRFGPAGKSEAVPAHCPVDHSADEDILCPFGFWGLSCLIEQPPSSNYDLTQIVTSVGDPDPLSFLVVTDPELDPDLTRRHVGNLEASLHEGITHPDIESSRDLARVLGPEKTDVAYLYCHCGYQKLSDRALPSVVLRLGSHSIGPLDVSKWARSPQLWPRPHWPNRKPLVILNGCHTTDFTSGTLSDFVSAFVNRAGAAGVIGTEVAVEQNLAGFLMEIFLTNLAAGMATGEALRDARWQLVGYGNVMGLGYTPYCLSGLRLRP